MYALDGTHVLYCNAGTWYLAPDVFTVSVAYHSTVISTPNVSLTGWVTDFGTAPVPILTGDITPAAPTLFPFHTPGPQPSITIDTPAQPSGADTYCDIQYSDDGGSTWHDWDTANVPWSGSRTYNWPSPVPLVPGATYQFRCVAYTTYHSAGSTPGTAASCTLLGPIQTGGAGFFFGP